MLFIAVASSSAQAQTVIPNIVVTHGGSAVEFSDGSSTLVEPVPIGKQTKISVRCDPTKSKLKDCTKLKAKMTPTLDQAVVELAIEGPVTPTSVTFSLEAFADKALSSTVIQLEDDGTALAKTLRVTPPAPRVTGSTAPAPAVSGSKAQLYALRCTPKIIALEGYDAEGDSAQLEMDLAGNVVQGLGQALDEDDTLEVFVQVPPRLAGLIQVRLVGDLRDVGAYRILGSEASLPATLVSKEGSPPPCEVMSFQFKDIKAGSVELQVVYLGSSPELLLGRAKVRVRAIYTGALSFGGSLFTPRRNEFVVNDAEIVDSFSGDRGIEYLVMYHHFWRGGRDVEKDASGFFEWFVPTVGIPITRDLLDRPRLYAGLSLNLDWVYVSAGGVLSVEQTLGSDLRAGGTFDGETDDLPIRRQGELGAFAAVTLDLRAVRALFGAFGQ